MTTLLISYHQKKNEFLMLFLTMVAFLDIRVTFFIFM